MTTDRSCAYARVTKTVADLGPAKLHDLEQRRIRNAADALVFAGAHDLEALAALDGHRAAHAGTDQLRPMDAAAREPSGRRCRRVRSGLGLRPRRIASGYDRLTRTVEQLTGQPAQSVEAFVAAHVQLFARDVRATSRGGGPRQGRLPPAGRPLASACDVERDPLPALRGRRGECEALDRLVADVGRGREPRAGPAR